ncbi:ATP-dependent protease ClpP protease subunit [Bradyrhizobium sp. GM24.11]
MLLKFVSPVPRGIDLAWGTVPRRDTVSYLRAIYEAGDRTIICYVDDAGGEAEGALLIARALLEHPYRVESRIIGRCSSSATWLALASDWRSIVPSGSVLVHRAARICTREQYEAIQRLPAAGKDTIDKLLDDTDAVTAALLCARLGISEMEAWAWMSEDRRWSASVAHERGFVNAITEMGALCG